MLRGEYARFRVLPQIKAGTWCDLIRGTLAPSANQPVFLTMAYLLFLPMSLAAGPSNTWIGMGFPQAAGYCCQTPPPPAAL